MSTVNNTQPASLDATTDRFLQKLAAQGGPPLYTLSPTAARAVLTDVQAGDSEKPEADSEDRIISGGPTGEIALRIVRPRDLPGPLPVVMHFHGGGWILGDKETHDRLVRDIATGAQATVVFVDYARCPPSPAGRMSYGWSHARTAPGRAIYCRPVYWRQPVCAFAPLHDAARRESCQSPYGDGPHPPERAPQHAGGHRRGLAAGGVLDREQLAAIVGTVAPRTHGR